MSDGQHSQETPESIATLLRLAADGELSPEQESRLAAHLEAHPQDKARIEFERRMQQACARACGPECCAPSGLRERVVASCCTGADRIAESTRERSFWSARNFTRVAAVAAVIALVAAASFMVGRGNSPASGPGVAEPGFATQLASFARREHGRCVVTQGVLEGKFSIGSPEELPGEFEQLVGEHMTFSSILTAEAEGLRFVDAGRCNPPGGPALHIRFALQGEDDPASLVSLWVQLDGSEDLEEGRTYCSGAGCDRVRVWVVDGVRYTLVCSRADQGNPAQNALGAPIEITEF